MNFLPSLFGRRPAAGQQQLSTESKVVLADYYSSILNESTRLHEPARNWPIEAAVREGYDRVIWCYKAVATIGENTAREDVPFEVVSGPEDSPEVQLDHPVAKLLNGQANPLETGEVFLERLSAQLLLSKKGAFIEMGLSNSGTPVRLDLLPPSRTRIVPGFNELIDHFEVTRLDGTKYFLPPERVRWIRKPHPIDPFSGTTPLEAAGLSLELDYFARLYNVSFMRNDGRPGGIVGITGPEAGGGGLNEGDMQELENRFGGRGPTEAGRISVVEGGITYADLAAKPRDSQYQGVSANAKTEILAAFGVPESVLGNSSERTYANAEAEKYHFWVTTMLPHLSRIASAFLVDVDDGHKCRFNVNKIDVLELPARERRKEARDEVAAGLRSIKSYVDMAGRSDEVEDLPHTRALWVPMGKTPLPAQESDAAELGAAPAGPAPGAAPAAAPGAPDPMAPPAPADVPPAGLGGDTAGGPGTPGPKPGGRDLFSGVTAPNVPAPRRPQPATKGWAAHLQVVPQDTGAVSEAMLYGGLSSLVPRWSAKTAERLRSPRTRKGTRHYAGTGGTKVLDAAYCADADSWGTEAEEVARPLVTSAGLTAAAEWLTAATGKTAVADDLPAAVEQAVRSSTAAALPALITGAAWQARRSARLISDADAGGASIDQIAEAVTGRDTELQAWVSVAAGQAAAAATQAGHAAAAAWYAGAGNTVSRTWVTAEDCTRDHAGLDGQIRGTKALFSTGGAQLRYPHDPLGPPGQVLNCRCQLTYTIPDRAVNAS